MTTSTGQHERTNTSWSSDAERRLLIYLARRLPEAVRPDHLTALGLAALVSTGLCFALSSQASFWLWLVPVFLFINWVGDSLDGTLARVRDQSRPRYGFFVDHVCDIVGSVAVFAGLGLSPLMHGSVAAALLVAYLCLSAETYLATHSLGRFEMSFFGIGPTELRILLGLGTLVAMARPSVVLLGHSLRLFDVGALAGILGLAFTFALASIRNTRRLAELEPAPARRHPSAASSSWPGSTDSLSAPHRRQA